MQRTTERWLIALCLATAAFAIWLHVGRGVSTAQAVAERMQAEATAKVTAHLAGSIVNCTPPGPNEELRVQRAVPNSADVLTCVYRSPIGYGNAPTKERVAKGML